jgi:GWxTD domain-containing protein
MNRAKVPLSVMGMVAILCFSTQILARPVQTQLAPEYAKWLHEEVRWIITDQERAEFLALKSDSARDQFVTEFWEQRNPAPGSSRNRFKEEHYRRLAFANQHFAARTQGDETDRGHIYVVYGPPDEITSHSDSHIPSQTWYYRHLSDQRACKV